MNWKNEMDFSSVIAPHLTLSSLENDYQKTMTKKQCMVVIPSPTPTTLPPLPKKICITTTRSFFSLPLNRFSLFPLSIDKNHLMANNFY